MPKLEVGNANDPLEREADAVADRVMRMPAPQELFDRGTTSDLDGDSEVDGEDELTEAPMVGGFAGGAALPGRPSILAHRKCSSCEDGDTMHRVVDDEDELQRQWPKLEVGDSNDPLEREADAIADRVMRTPMPSREWSNALTPGPGFVAQRKCASCEVEHV